MQPDKPTTPPTEVRATSRRRWFILGSGAVLLLGALGVIGLLGSGGGGAGTVCDGRASKVDKQVPLLEGRNIDDGSPLRYEPGPVTVINVWGSWCGPCREEMPILVRAAERRPDVRFLGLDVQDNDAAGRAFEQEFGVPYPSISDPARELASQLGAVATPSTFVIDAGGVIRAQVLGVVRPDTLECMIDVASSV